MNSDYIKWKRDNVTYRGIKNIYDKHNSFAIDPLLGEGLYSVPKSNIKMAKTYGDIYILVNAKPKNPKIVNTLNDWQIWFQDNILKNFNYDKRKFNQVTTIRAEMLKLGYDGVIIKGREMVNYTPKNVMYFETERQLEMYYETNVSQD